MQLLLVRALVVVLVAASTAGLAAPHARGESKFCAETKSRTCASKPEYRRLEDGQKPARVRTIVGGTPAKAYVTVSSCECPSSKRLNYVYEAEWFDGDVFLVFEKNDGKWRLTSKRRVTAAQ